jgi:hypothetical protein
MKYEYYYNRTPQGELWRNNLIYTSLISEDKKVFVKHFVNDSEYHKGQNQVVDPELMEAKWQRELRYLRLMHAAFNDLVPRILDIDEKHKKIYLEIDGVDLWQRQLDGVAVPDNWQDQIIDIHNAHKGLGLYKFSQHPSSYFVVGDRLKSINYFFTYHMSEDWITIEDHLSHIYSTRQEEIRKNTDRLGISWTEPQPWEVLEDLCWESFRTNYPADFIEKIKCIK